ncbi:hypothetical protein HBB16_09550 [Pseudonocardia sp. MCCB 268]|nr:hypothetical protein [Pseudonocardia cytotoxica]
MRRGGRPYLDAELATLREALERNRAEGGSSRTISGCGGSSTRRRSGSRTRSPGPHVRVETSRPPASTTSSSTGAHDYRELAPRSNIADFDHHRPTPTGLRDLALKLHYRGMRGRQVVTFATAAPIANSITEGARHAKRYLR